MLSAITAMLICPVQSVTGYNTLYGKDRDKKKRDYRRITTSAAAHPKIAIIIPNPGTGVAVGEVVVTGAMVSVSGIVAGIAVVSSMTGVVAMADSGVVDTLDATLTDLMKKEETGCGPITISASGQDDAGASPLMKRICRYCWFPVSAASHVSAGSSVSVPTSDTVYSLLFESYATVFVVTSTELA